MVRVARAIAGAMLLLGMCAGCGAGHALLWGTNPATAYGCPYTKHAPLPSRDAPDPSLESVAMAGSVPQPDVPPMALESNVDGVVVVDALVCEHGRVLKTHVAKSIPMLDLAAVDAVQRMSFRPARRDGHDVSSWVPVEVTFGPY